jgi:hypothetical protein
LNSSQPVTEVDINNAKTGVETDRATMAQLYEAETVIETKVKEMKDRMNAL